MGILWKEWDGGGESVAGRALLGSGRTQGEGPTFPVADRNPDKSSLPPGWKPFGRNWSIQSPPSQIRLHTILVSLVGYGNIRRRIRISRPLVLSLVVGLTALLAASKTRRAACGVKHPCSEHETMDRFSPFIGLTSPIQANSRESSGSQSKAHSHQIRGPNPRDPKDPLTVDTFFSTHTGSRQPQRPTNQPTMAENPAAQEVELPADFPQDYLGFCK